MTVVFTEGDNGFARMRERYESAQQTLVTDVQEAIGPIVESIRFAIDDGPGGLNHIVTGRLNDSLHGENEDSVEILLKTEDGFQIVIGSLDPAAVFQARRFADTEGPVVPVDAEMVRREVRVHFLARLKETP